MPATSRESQNHRCGNVRLAALPSHRFKLVQLLQNGVEFLYFRLTRANDNNFSSSSISGFTRRLNSHFNVSSNYQVNAFLLFVFIIKVIAAREEAALSYAPQFL